MSFLPRLGAVALALLAASQAACAQGNAPASPPSRPAAAAPQPTSSPGPAAAAAAAGGGLGAELFYQLLLGELNARSDDPGMGFSLVLDAARKTNNPELYQRAVEIAFQSRAGESALQAARAWKQAHPGSREANRYVLQILLALNRVPESLEPLRSELSLAPASERAAVLAALPRLYARVSDKKQAAAVVEQALAEWTAREQTRASAWTALGRVRLAAGDTPGAVTAAQRAHSADPSAEGPALLALELMDPKEPQAEAMVLRYLAGPKALPELRMAYARVLLDAQRAPEAVGQLQQITTERPEFPEAWLVLGALQVQQNRLEEADAAFKRYLELARAAEGSGEERARGRAQAYLGLAQVAEKRQDLAQANAWLDRIENPQELVAAQTRRASIMARQGRLEDARELLRGLPERTPAEARTKLMAQVQLLRENRQYKAAQALLQEASAKEPADAELLYDWAMLAEKMGDHAEAERLLRKAIELKPDFHHAYNALGYSLADRNQRLPEAKRLIQKALEFAPGDPFITDSLAWVEYRMGNQAEALRLLERAFRQRPDAEIAAHLGEVLWSMGQRERAQAVWREGLMVDRENETLQQTLKRLQVTP
ncbi:tetratricopeptide repeat protein [Ramlibacter rhizophilus]|uniref:Tetratricopeptide repeat protein n=1 Tax=Ramlibacter rhizophilus TaxID=1781167 RepID=A0A4Z0BPB3_9BURK|nr:tetratricopeptide repeat protein [Ramlibacter rhizophilus]TFZ01143.1 tetratricopeptide repeat protein [Ramlibacter rhizophilus]